MNCPRCDNVVPDGTTVSPCCGRPMATEPVRGGHVSYDSHIVNADWDKRSHKFYWLLGGGYTLGIVDLVVTLLRTHFHF